MDVDKELRDLFSDPLLDVSDKELTLFNLPADMKRVMEGKRKSPDYKAERKPCEDFYVYEPLFAQIQSDLKSGKRSLVKANKTADFIQENRFFVIDGMLVYIASIGEIVKDRSGRGHNKDARTRCIYENGMESDVLAQSLRRAIYADGYGVTESEDKSDQNLISLAEGDKSTGYIYILRSLSPKPEIAGVKNLYKIGFTINSVEERVANAEHEPTYLMAPVQIMSTAQIVNMNSHMFETLVHQVFQAVNFQIKVYDDNGIEHEPSEWYVAPLEIIELVIQKIADRSIVNYTYNAEMQCLEKRIVKKGSTFDVKGLRVLTLNIKKENFDPIISGEKKVELRELTQTTLNRYTYIDEADGKRYLRPYDVLRLYVGYHKDRESALVEVTDIIYDKVGVIEYHLGRVLEVIPN